MNTNSWIVRDALAYGLDVVKRDPAELLGPDWKASMDEDKERSLLRHAQLEDANSDDRFEKIIQELV